MSLRRAGCRGMAILAMVFTAGCALPPAARGPDDATRDSTTSTTMPRLRPLTRQPAAPPGAAPQSAVASVNYDLSVSSADELPSDDGLPGDRRVLERGTASWYGIQFHQKKTANGERFDMTAMTAAHKTLPFGTRVCVRSLVNGREVLVRINDRGPYSAGRIIDLSRAAAEQIGLTGLGIKQVALSVIDRKEQRCGGETDVAGGDDPPVFEPSAPVRRKAPAASGSKALNPRQRR